jgi:hypothetical protein
MEELANRLIVIKEKVAALKERDKKLKLFGAWQHQYTFNAAATIEQVQAFESEHQLTLPEDYKAFITQIGNGGAGPYYGLRPLQHYNAHYIHHEVELTTTRLKDPFPSHYWLSEKETFITKEIVQESARGTISICEEGDGYNHLIVLSGKEKGNIWFDGCVSNQGMAPFTTQEKARFSFLDWYESWLEAANS